MSDLSDTVVVFDLDDTLYPEEAYVRSGIAAVCGAVQAAFGRDLTAQALATWDEDRDDWLKTLCDHLPPSERLKSALLWSYRTHAPDIALTLEMQSLLTVIQASAGGCAILTDGRSLTQRLKLAALGLAHLPVYVSDEYGGRSKPDPARFEAVMNAHPAVHYIYVGDNPAKDFVAPNRLGWQTIGVRFWNRAIHSRWVTLPEGSSPLHWVETPSDLLKLLTSSAA